MSIGLMTLAWKTDLPSGRKIVLLALCDHANDQGECYPSIEAISRKCSMGVRTVQQHLVELEATGILVRRFRSGRSTVYKLDPHSFHNPAASAVVHNSAPVDTISAPPSPQLLQRSPAGSTPIIANEPSTDPSPKRQMVRGTRLESTWELPWEWAAWAQQQQPTWTVQHVGLVANKFRDYWVSLPGHRGIKSDWFATWRNWCRNEPPLSNDRPVGQDRWWATNATALAKATALGLTPLPGESITTFKSRIQSVLDNAGKQVLTKPFAVTITHPESLRKVNISSANRLAALHAARSLKSRQARKDAPQH